MRTILLALAAFAALVSFPASAADSATTTPLAGLRLFSLHDAPDVAPNALSCRRAIFNPASMQMFAAQGVVRFSPAVVLDGDTCKVGTATGLVINFYGLHEDPPDQITAGEGAYIFMGNLAAFQQAIYHSLQHGW